MRELRINVNFIYNGKEKITLQCNKNELINDLIERFKMRKRNINNNLSFFQWNNKILEFELNYDSCFFKKLFPELYVGETGLINNSTIDVIDTKVILYA